MELFATTTKSISIEKKIEIELTFFIELKDTFMNLCRSNDNGNQFLSGLILFFRWIIYKLFFFSLLLFFHTAKHGFR